jgi:rhodanese-related sulfurtransferase
MTKMSAQEALRRQGEIIILDARNAASRARRDDQIPGAIWIPSGEVGARLKELPRGRPIVTFCA